MTTELTDEEIRAEREEAITVLKQSGTLLGRTMRGKDEADQKIGKALALIAAIDDSKVNDDAIDDTAIEANLHRLVDCLDCLWAVRKELS